MKTSNDDNSLWIYPWDMVDEGISKTCKELKEMGYQSLSLATSYHAGKLLLPHNPKKKVLFLEDGTVYFHPDMKKYGAIKPLPSAIAKNQDILGKVCREAQKIGLNMNAWTVLLHNSRLGNLHPDCCSQNCYGDIYTTSLCPSNQDARNYVVTLCSDLARNYELQSLELESFEYMGFYHGYHHEKILVELPKEMDFLLSLCFCHSCIEEAKKRNIPFQKLKKEVRRMLDDFLETGKEKKIDNILLLPYIQMRIEIVSSLIETIYIAIQKTGTVLRPIISGDVKSYKKYGIDLNEINQWIDAPIILGYGDKARLEQTLGDYFHYHKKAPIPILGFSLAYTSIKNKQDLKSRLAISRNKQIHRFNFYNYGLVRRNQLSWPF